MSDRVVLVGRNDTATSTETIEVAHQGAGSVITYTNDVHFNGAAKLAAPAAKLVFEKLGNDTERQLVRNAQHSRGVADRGRGARRPQGERVHSVTTPCGSPHATFGL